MPSILPCNFKSRCCIQELRQNILLVLFITLCMGFWKVSFNWKRLKEQELPCLHVTGFKLVVPKHFKLLSKLSSWHWAFAASVKTKSDPVNTNTVVSNPKNGAFSQRKILWWWLSLWVLPPKPPCLVLGKTSYEMSCSIINDAIWTNQDVLLSPWGDNCSMDHEEPRNAFI